MNITNFDKLTDFQRWVIIHSFTRDELSGKRREYHEISISFNGVETDFVEWCNNLESAIDNSIEKKAIEIVRQQFDDIVNTTSELWDELDSIKSDFVTKVRHRLELPTYEEQFGES